MQRKCIGDRVAMLQLLRGSNDITGEHERSLANVIGFFDLAL
jgi:hypothetical protein